MATLTRVDLVEAVAAEIDVSRAIAEAIVETVIRTMGTGLKQGEKIELRGFGSFRLRRRAARVARNPKKGDVVEVPAKWVPYFKPGKELKGLLNRGGEDGPHEKGEASRVRGFQSLRTSAVPKV